MTDDMTDFERQLARGLDRMGGPGRRIDAVAMVHAVRTTTPVGNWAVVRRRLGSRARPNPTDRGLITLSAVRFVAAAAVVALFGGILLSGALTTQQGDGAVPGAVVTSASPSATEPGSGTVSVTVDGLEGASGSRLAAILYEGVPALASGDTPFRGLGSFAADITSDPFTVTDSIREGSGWWDSTADHPVANVPSGIHTVIIFVSHRLGPYNEWLPAEPLDAACAVHLTVIEGEQASVRVSLSPADGYGVFNVPGCEVMHDD